MYFTGFIYYYNSPAVLATINYNRPYFTPGPLLPSYQVQVWTLNSLPT